MSSGKTNKVHTNKLTVDKQSCFKGEATFCDDIKVKGAVCGNLNITGDLCVGGNIEQCNGTYDVIICGVGTAGGVAFRRISDSDPSLSILGLVTGPNHNEDPVSKYPFYPNPISGLGIISGIVAAPPYAENIYNTNAFQNLSYVNKAMPYGCGYGMGGASMHNFLFAARPTSGFHTYASTFAGPYSADWSAANCSAIYQAMETYIGPPAQPNRGYSGPFRILQNPVPPNSTYGDTMGDIANSVKNQSLAPQDNALTITADYNNDVELALVKSSQNYLYPDGGSPIGVSRSSVGEAYLNTDFITPQGFSAIGRNNRLITNAAVNRILFDGDGNAVGVEVFIEGKCKVFKANKKIIICCGSLRTPGVLERSGIGSGTRLSSLGISQVVENPNVGENLSNHSYMPMYWVEVDKDAFVPGGMNAFLKATSSSTPYGYNRQLNLNLEYYGQLANGLTFLYGNNAVLDKCIGISNESLNSYFGFNYLCQPDSKGSVHIVDALPNSTPRLIHDIYTPHDIYLMRTGYQTWKRVESDLQANHPTMGFVLKYPDAVAFAGYPGAPTIAFTASITGAVMTVSAVSSGTLEPYMTVLEGAAFSTAPASVVIQGTMIQTQVFPLLVGETVGGKGRYNVNISQTVGSILMHGDFLEMYAAACTITNSHQSGTCRMGDRNTQQGVVDGQLHVYGVQKLMVADNSIWPTVPNINTTMSAMLAGYRAADICLATI